MVAFVGLLELRGARSPKPELLSHVWVQIMVPDLVTLVRNVDHAIKNYMALRGVQGALLIHSTACVAFAPAKLMDTLLRALIGAFRVHSHRLEALLDVHAVALKE